MFVRWTFAAAGGLALLAACSSSSSDPAADVAGACNAIASACHAYDTGAGIGAECHDLGHAGDDAKCAPRRAECLAACPETDGGYGGHGGHGEDAGNGGAADAGADAAADPMCVELCTCLDATCKAQQGYPFGAEGSCLAACAKLSAEAKECYPKWCAKAKSSGGGHDCEHAWGKFGLVECDSL